MTSKTTPYLIAHTDLVGANTAQATIEATTESRARASFAEQYPERLISVVAIREGRAPTRRERSWR